MGLSTEHFIRRFKNRFGLSPKVYHTRARLQEAARSLRAAASPSRAWPITWVSAIRSPLRAVSSTVWASPHRICDPALRPTRVENVHPHKRGFPINVHLVPPPLNWSGFGPLSAQRPSRHDDLRGVGRHPGQDTAP